MHTEPSILGRRPVGYLTNAEGKRTHAIVPLTDEADGDPWENLPTVMPDADDLKFFARFDKNPDAFLAPAPVKNPIRLARKKAGITQEVLAAALGISAAALSKQEMEGHEPRPRTVERALKRLRELER